MKLRFKSSEIRTQWETSPRKPKILDDIVNDFVVWAYAEFEWEPVATSFIRSAEEDAALGGSGVHARAGALDIRTIGVPDNEVSAAVEYLNGRYRYDPGRPRLPVAYAKPHGNARHLHIQTHPNTVRK